MLAPPHRPFSLHGRIAALHDKQYQLFLGDERPGISKGWIFNSSNSVRRRTVIADSTPISPATNRLCNSSMLLTGSPRNATNTSPSSAFAVAAGLFGSTPRIKIPWP